VDGKLIIKDLLVWYPLLIAYALEVSLYLALGIPLGNVLSLISEFLPSSDCDLDLGFALR
jgi:hypothetical protein